MIDVSVYYTVLMKKLGLLSTSIGQWGNNYKLKRHYSFEGWLQKGQKKTNIMGEKTRYFIRRGRKSDML